MILRRGRGGGQCVSVILPAKVLEGDISVRDILQKILRSSDGVSAPRRIVLLALATHVQELREALALLMNIEFSTCTTEIMVHPWEDERSPLMGSLAVLRPHRLGNLLQTPQLRDLMLTPQDRYRC